MKAFRIIALLLMGLVATIDQITKILILNNRECLPLDVMPCFNLVLAWNRGISFGLFNQQGPWVFWILTALSSGILVGLVLYLFRQTRWQKMMAIALVAGGAIGNIIDRLWHGAVVDFLDVHLYNYHWPAFNVADSCIVLGVFWLLWESYEKN